MDTIQNYLSLERQKNLTVLSEFIDQEFTHFDDDHFALDFLASIKKYLITGGKFGRPLLAKLAYEHISGALISDDVELACVATELLHRFILVHDDIIDGDLSRHGQPTLETLFSREAIIAKEQSLWWGRSMAMVAGDIIHSLVDQSVLITSLSPHIKAQVIKGLHQCLVQTALGWRLETKLKTLSLSQVDMREVEQAMMLVSGEYSVRWPLRIGQLLAGSDFEWSEALETFGQHIGLAFQMQDDILGIFGDSAQTGKPVGGDIREAKKTHLLMHAYTHANRKQQKVLEGLLGHEISEDELATIRQIFDETGSLTHVQHEINSHLEHGLNAINAENHGSACIKLDALARFLCSRDH